MNSAYGNPYTVAAAAPTERAAFIRQTYLHLGFAILAFIGVEWFLLNHSIGETLIGLMLGTKYSWLVVLDARFSHLSPQGRYEDGDGQVRKLYTAEAEPQVVVRRAVWACMIGSSSQSEAIRDYQRP